MCHWFERLIPAWYGSKYSLYRSPESGVEVQLECILWFELGIYVKEISS